MPQGSMRLQENTFMFHLTPQQSTDVASSRDCRAGSKMDYTVQVHFEIIFFKTILNLYGIFYNLNYDCFRYKCDFVYKRLHVNKKIVFHQVLL